MKKEEDELMNGMNEKARAWKSIRQRRMRKKGNE